MSATCTSFAAIRQCKSTQWKLTSLLMAMSVEDSMNKIRVIMQRKLVRQAVPSLLTNCSDDLSCACALMTRSTVDLLCRLPDSCRCPISILGFRNTRPLPASTQGMEQPQDAMQGLVVIVDAVGQPEIT